MESVVNGSQIDGTKHRLLRRKAVQDVTGMSRSSIYAEMKKKRFPQAVNLGGRSVAWVEQEIELWINERVINRDTQNNR